LETNLKNDIFLFHLNKNIQDQALSKTSECFTNLFGDL